MKGYFLGVPVDSSGRILLTVSAVFALRNSLIRLDQVFGERYCYVHLHTLPSIG